MAFVFFTLQGGCCKYFIYSAASLKHWDAWQVFCFFTYFSDISFAVQIQSNVLWRARWILALVSEWFNIIVRVQSSFTLNLKENTQEQQACVLCMELFCQGTLFFLSGESRGGTRCRGGCHWPRSLSAWPSIQCRTFRLPTCTIVGSILCRWPVVRL